MFQKILYIGERIVQPATRLWRGVPFRLQGKIQVALPLLAVMISAGLAVFGHYQRARIEIAIQRQFQTIAGLNEVLTLMVNADCAGRRS